MKFVRIISKPNAPRYTSLWILIERVCLVFNDSPQMIQGATTLLDSSCVDNNNMKAKIIVMTVKQDVLIMKIVQFSFLPRDFSSKWARARLSTNTTSTSKTNCSTKELSSLKNKKIFLLRTHTLYSEHIAEMLWGYSICSPHLMRPLTWIAYTCC